MLIVALDTSKKEPLYEQIYNSIKEEIITGVLPFGARLPSARRLSKHLDVSRNTVDTAYAQLCAEGYIESKPKRGFFVCQVEELAELHIPVKIEEEEEEIRPEKIPYDFSSAGVDMEQFPYHIWRKLLKEIMINDNSELFQKGNFQGDLELRMRTECRKRKIKHLKVVYSKEPAMTPIEDDSISCKDHCICPPGTQRKCTVRRAVPGSNAFVPSVAGLIIGGEVVKDLVGFVPLKG